MIFPWGFTKKAKLNRIQAIGYPGVFTTNKFFLIVQDRWKKQKIIIKRK
jgi:hypothetical protein